MVEWQKFLETASLLYSLWPTFFNLLGGVSISIVPSVALVTWWLRSREATLKEAVLEGKIIALEGVKNAEIARLKGQIDGVMERFALANELQKAAKEEVEKFKAELKELKEKSAKGEAIEEFQLAPLEGSLSRLLTANNNVTSTLGTPIRGMLHEFGIVPFDGLEKKSDRRM